jgi:hypothetical protein
VSALVSVVNDFTETPSCRTASMESGRSEPTMRRGVSCKRGRFCVVARTLLTPLKDSMIAWD